MPGPRYSLGTPPTTATALAPGAVVRGAPLDRTCTTVLRVRLRRGAAMFVGVAPSTIAAEAEKGAPAPPTQGGWFLHVPSLTLHSGRPQHCRGTRAAAPQQGPLDAHAPVTLTFNARAHTLRFSTAPGTYLPGRYARLTLPQTLQFLPVVLLLRTDDSVELLQPS